MHQLEVLLVNRDGLLLERECLFLEDALVVEELGLRQVCGALRRKQRAAEVAVDLRHVVRGGRGNLANLVVDQPAEAGERRVHPLLLLLQAPLEGLHELDLGESAVEPLGQHQRGPGRQIPDTVGPLGTCSAVELDDSAKLRVLALLVARRRVKGRDLEAHLDCDLERCGIALDVAEVDAHRALGDAGVFIQLARREQSISPQLVVVGLGRNALVFDGSSLEFALLAVDLCELLGDLSVERVVGMRLAERVEHVDRCVPVLETDQRRAGVVLGRGADRRFGHEFCDAQEVIGSGPMILGLARLFALLVDRGGQVVDHVLARLIIVRRHLEHAHVGLLGLRVVVDAESRVRDREPRGAPDRRVGLGIGVEQPPTCFDRGLELAHLVEVVDRGAQHVGRVLVCREDVHEAKRARNRGLASDLVLLARNPLLVLAVCVDRRVTGLGGLIVCGIVVRGALVLARRLAEVLVLEQQVGEVLVDDRCLGVLGEGGQEGAVPLVRLAKARSLLLRLLGILIGGVVVVREISEIALQVVDDLGRLLDREVRPVVRPEPVTRRELLLGHEHELREAAGLVDLDHAHAEMRRCTVLRVERNERLVCARGVLVAELLEVELAEVAVDTALVGAGTLYSEVRVDRLGASDARETQADDAEGVLDPPAGVLVLGLIEVVSCRYLVVEQRDVLVQRLLVEFLLVERPAELVEREFVEGRDSAVPGDCSVGLLGVEIAAAREEVLGAAELHLVDMTRVRIQSDQLLGHGDRLVRTPELVVRARLLVEHPVVVLVARVGRKDAVVELDRLERAHF